MRVMMAIAALIALAAGGAALGGAALAGARGNVPPHRAVAVADSGKPITLKAVDGVTIHGTLYAAPHPKAVILLFHQAGSGKGEYATIAPRLVAQGYTALAIDQRSGGTLFGTNETAAELGHQASFLDAKTDLQAALDWARPQRRPVILWGSSYSAALVFLVAAENPGRLAAVMAFSPGEYLGDPTLVRQAASHVDVPVFVTSAKDTAEVKAARDVLATVMAHARMQFVPKIAGVHGSATLIAARNPRGAVENWRAVEAFLRAVAP